MRKVRFDAQPDGIITAVAFGVQQIFTDFEENNALVFAFKQI
jgi:hypothetical protein